MREGEREKRKRQKKGGEEREKDWEAQFIVMSYGQFYRRRVSKEWRHAQTKHPPPPPPTTHTEYTKLKRIFWVFLSRYFSLAVCVGTL